MAPKQVAESVVQAVVVYNGRLLLMERQDGWGLPSGTAELAESTEAAAARLVYEQTGYLVDGSATLPPETGAPAHVGWAVVCQLITESPSVGTQPAQQSRWVPIEEAIADALPGPVRDYLKGHTPV